MINIIQNTVSALKSSLGIIRKGLELFLPFAKSEIIGKELVVNGGFDTDSDWGTSGNQWEFLGGQAIYTGDGTSNELLQPVTIIGGQAYNVVIDVQSISGTLKFRFNNDQANKETFNSTGVKTFSFIASGSGSISTELSISRETGTVSSTLSSISFKPITQFAPDKSTNTNDAKLFTGKALSFDGVNDYVDADYSSSTRTIAFWIKPRGSGTSEGIMYLGYSGGQMGIKFGNSTISTSVLTGVTTYVNNVNTTSITLDVWQRVVITTDLFTPTVLRLGYTYLNAYGDYSITDLQFYDTAWTAADVTYDYNNPQNLVTDNSASSIALSNLKGYWHLSEGDGANAYNSAIALGSEEVTNGDFSDSDISHWTHTASGTAEIINETLKLSGGTAGYADHIMGGIGTLSSGKSYKISFEVTSLGDGQNIGIYSGSDGYILGAGNYDVGIHSFVYIPSFSVTVLDFVCWGSTSQFKYIDNISVKEVSAGTINGATWETAQATIPQLGMMDWAKSTVGSDEITLIQAPNNEGYDILGNALRLRENAFNLDGSGYAKVANDDSLDITTTITLEAWVKLEPFKTGILDHIIGKRIGGSWCRLYRPSANVLRMEIAAGGNLDIDVVDGEWCHIVGTINGTSGKLYYNSGAPEETVYGSTFTWDIDVPIGIGAWFVSDSGISATSKTLGIIDEPRVYNRALSASEITQNYKAGKNKHKN